MRLIEQRATDALGDVAQRGEGERGEEAVAGAPVPGRVREALLDLLDQRGLPAAGLTLDEHEATGARRCLGRVAEDGIDLGVALQERGVHAILQTSGAA